MLLAEVRIGVVSEKSLLLLRSRQHLNWKALDIKPTILYSRNYEADLTNKKELAKLKKPIITFKTTTVNATGELITPKTPPPNTNAPYDVELQLCENAQVMLITNLDVENGLVNGSMVYFLNGVPLPPVLNGVPLPPVLNGVPLPPTLDGVPLPTVLDGVPLPPVLNGVPLPPVLDGVPLPPVLDGVPLPPTLEKLIEITPHIWYNNSEAKEVNASAKVGRSQIPLRIAYAITIHKSQGATLNCALIDLGSNVFEAGQAYVALSRVSSIEGLYIYDLDPSRIIADNKVKAFYSIL